jgi:hypothetical protein
MGSPPEGLASKTAPEEIPAPNWQGILSLGKFRRQIGRGFCPWGFFRGAFEANAVHGEVGYPLFSSKVLLGEIG